MSDNEYNFAQEKDIDMTYQNFVSPTTDPSYLLQPRTQDADQINQPSTIDINIADVEQITQQIVTLENINTLEPNNLPTRTTRNVISNAQRQTVIDNYGRGLRIIDIANFMSLPRGTIYTIINIFNRQNRNVANRRGGDNRSILTLEDKNRIYGWVDDDPCITLRAICIRVETELSKTISAATAQRCLKEFHYTIKRLITVPERRNTPNTIQVRKSYAQNFLELIGNIRDEKTFFLDEVGFCVSMRQKYGRARVGTSPVVNIRSIRSRNISVCCSINKNGILDFTIRNTAFNGQSIHDYIFQIFATLKDRGLSNCVIIMDNAATHRVELVRNLFTEHGHQLMFLPPYSPFLNPIENMFSKWKGLVKQAACTTEIQLNTEISTSIRRITIEDCNGYWRNMFRYITRSMNEEIIND